MQILADFWHLWANLIKLTSNYKSNDALGVTTRQHFRAFALGLYWSIRKKELKRDFQQPFIRTFSENCKRVIENGGMTDMQKLRQNPGPKPVATRQKVPADLASGTARSPAANTDCHGGRLSWNPATRPAGPEFQARPGQLAWNVRLIIEGIAFTNRFLVIQKFLPYVYIRIMRICLYTRSLNTLQRSEFREYTQV